MLAPLMGVEAGKIYYVNPSLIQFISPGPDLREEAPDGSPWPSCYVTFSDENTIHAKGTAAMILQSWFGRPGNAEPEQNRVIVPPAYVRVPKGKIQ